MILGGGDEYVYFLDETDGTGDWQTSEWTTGSGSLPGRLAQQLNACYAKGRYITDVAHGPNDEWFVAGKKRDGSGEYSWWGGTLADESIKELAGGSHRLQVSFGDSGRWALLQGNNGYSMSGNVADALQARVQRIHARSAKIHCIRLLPGGGYFISDSEGYEWNPGSAGQNLSNELKSGGKDAVLDVAVASNGAWLIIRPERFQASTGVSDDLTSRLHQFYREHKQRSQKQAAVIAQYDARARRETEERAAEALRQGERRQEEQREREREMSRPVRPTQGMADMPTRLGTNLQITCDKCGTGCNEYPRFQRNNENYDLCKCCYDAIVSARPAVQFEFTTYPHKIEMHYTGFGSQLRFVHEAPKPRVSFKVNFDGACQPNPGVGGGGIEVSHGTQTIMGSTPFGSLETSNTAEYKGLLFGLRHVRRLAEQGVPLNEVELVVHGDSELIIRQMLDEYDVNDPELQVLHALAKVWSKPFQRIIYRHVPRAQNTVADAQAKQALAGGFPENIFTSLCASSSAHSVTAVHGTGWSRLVRGSTDFGMETAARSPEEGGPPLFLVDAAFLASLPTHEGHLIRVPPMQRALGEVKPHPTLRVLRCRGATMTIRGVIELELGLQQGNTFKVTALVIHKLPVPLHIARSELQEVRSRIKLMTGFGANLFPQNYHAHPFWLSSSAAASPRRPASARDPPVHGFCGLAIGHQG